MTDKLAVNADTYIDEGRRGTNNGDSGAIVLSNASDKKYGLLHIPIPNLAGAVVQAAHLHVFLKGDNWSSGNVIKVDLLAARFKDDDTWHTYGAQIPSLPGADQATEALGGAHSDGHEVTIDVADLMTDAAAADAFYGLLLSVSSSSDRPLYSSDSRSRQLRPYLVINYSRAPASPDNLHPAIAASAEKPRLSWSSTSQASFQVQISAAQDGDSPDSDTGQIFDVRTQLDTADSGLITFAGLVDEDTSAWRVRVWNDVGAVSAWSEWAEWTRHVYGTVSISTPASDGDPVDATTPSIGWTTSNNESQYRVLEDLSGYDSGIVVGNDDVTDSAEIPAGFVKRQGETYVVHVRAWDEFTRDAPGEQGYVEDVREFVYEPGVVTDPVDTLIVSNDGPFILLAWTRASVPDSFVIFANGEAIDIVAPADVAVADTSDEDYEYRYIRAEPGAETTYEIVAHDDDTGDSSDNPTGTATLRVIGIWLVVEGDAASIQLLGKDNIDLKISEDGATFYPLGSRSPVRIVNRIRGYAGTVSGILVRSELRDDALLLKRVPPGRNLIRLIFGSFNFPVDLGEMTVSEWPSVEGDPLYQFTAVFEQTGEPWPLPEEMG